MVLTYREGKSGKENGKREGRGAAVTREEDTLPHHILSLSRRRSQESRGLEGAPLRPCLQNARGNMCLLGRTD